MLGEGSTQGSVVESNQSPRCQSFDMNDASESAPNAFLHIGHMGAVRRWSSVAHGRPGTDPTNDVQRGSISGFHVGSGDGIGTVEHVEWLARPRRLLPGVESMVQE